MNTEFSSLGITGPLGFAQALSAIEAIGDVAHDTTTAVSDLTTVLERLKDKKTWETTGLNFPAIAQAARSHPPHAGRNAGPEPCLNRMLQPRG